MDVKADELKDQGNAAVRGGRYAEAVLHYTHALKVDPSNHLLHSNRSLAFLKLEQYYLALQDANRVIEMQPSWSKGFFRKAEVEFKAGHYDKALTSYKQAHSIDPTSKAIASAISCANYELIKEQRAVARQPVFFSAGGTGLGAVVILADQFWAASPSVSNILLQTVLVLCFTALGFGVFKLYRYFTVAQRKALLEPPVDLLAEMNGSQTVAETSSLPNDTHSKERQSYTRNKGGSATGRWRYRQGKH